MSVIAVIVIAIVVVLLIAMLAAPIRRSAQIRALATGPRRHEDFGPHRSRAEQSRSEAALAEERPERA